MIFPLEIAQMGVIQCRCHARKLPICWVSSFEGKVKKMSILSQKIRTYISVMVCYVTCCSANYGTITELTTAEAVHALPNVLTLSFSSYSVCLVFFSPTTE